MTDIKVNIPTNSQQNSKESSNNEAPKTDVKTDAKTDKAAGLDEEYTEVKKVIIASIARVSAYRAINSLAIGKPKTVIGSSINSTRKLIANKGEVEAYYPELVGMSANNPDFITTVKRYLSNIQIVVDGQKELDASFVYHHKKDYLDIKSKLDAVEAKYNSSNKTEKDASLRNDEINRI